MCFLLGIARSLFVAKYKAYTDTSYGIVSSVPRGNSL